MSNKKYNWNQIMRDVKIEIRKHIKEFSPRLPTLEELYVRLKEKYEGNDKSFPEKKEIFYREIRKKLNMPKDRRNHEPYLYKFVDSYDKLTLGALTDELTVTTTDQTNCFMLFIKLKNSNATKDKTQNKLKHLYYLSQKLKEKFPQEIVFTTFDTNALIIICRNKTAEEVLLNYIKQNSRYNQITEPTESEEK